MRSTRIGDWQTDAKDLWQQAHEAAMPVAEKIPVVSSFVPAADYLFSQATGRKTPPRTPPSPSSLTSHTQVMLRQLAQRPPSKSRVLPHPWRKPLLVGGGIAVAGGLAALLVHLWRR